MPLAFIIAVVGLTTAALALAAGGMALHADKMFPDGFEHDFGKVPSGIQVKHAFRVVNTSKVPLRIVSLRTS
jgi:hypothetical protein